ncbi:MAG: hypothetical protein ACR2M3_08450 [Thermomicrobiales bacterium]
MAGTGDGWLGATRGTGGTPGICVATIALGATRATAVGDAFPAGTPTFGVCGAVDPPHAASNAGSNK